ncbi:MAG: PAS domain S-box protein, partial [Chthoniobacterales bacterium]|nr:PAS domain S-box protein [Chthoniobacterales bacterium]
MNRSGNPDAAAVANISYGAPGNVPAAFLLDWVRDSIIVCDSTGRIEYWNSRCEELYGWSRKEALGANVHALLG